ncbi:hypothetical protein LTR10_019758 [Elasticomyces elasticus]|uniref:Uncharacterized protein n=1 Tax=Exophiala sideris TaxID=1016849 RepID=A0ABR0JEF8_9EURO|nr:hypothetical protein LTR10_019758 [Elasticomyces elasticus]KAK5061624.1 hypothetical protein LTR69_004806 [Exophiala sideris]KAK5184323.1 hypothetical protein LTR44_002996 [Eurotiomycetes sp. CCFEE 6388]
MAPTKLLESQVALVTGSGSGYGKGIAQLFAHEGAVVIVADINEEAGHRVVEAIRANGDKAEFLKLDVTDPEGWKKAVDFAKNEFGQIDILVNNAGWTYRRKDTELVTEFEYNKVFDINVKSIFYATNALIPHFLERGRGNIVNIGSCITENPTTGLPWYGATKGAVDMITRHLAAEYSPKGIRVNGVSPSIGETALMRDFIAQEPDEISKAALVAPVPLQRLCTPADVAKGALYFATSYFNDFQTGIILRVDGGHYI